MKQAMLSYQINQPVAQLKVAVVTPTYSREHWLARSYRYFGAQNNPFYAVRWFVLDDSPERSQHEFFSSDAAIDFRWIDQRIALGEKRNRLNESAMNWGGGYHLLHG